MKKLIKSANKEYRLNQKEIEHINTYRKLNTLGQDKADEYINDLTENPKYTSNKISHIKSFNLHEEYEIAAWGADGTEGTFKTHEEEIT